MRGNPNGHTLVSGPQDEAGSNGTKVTLEHALPVRQT